MIEIACKTLSSTYSSLTYESLICTCFCQSPLPIYLFLTISSLILLKEATSALDESDDLAEHREELSPSILNEDNDLLMYLDLFHLLWTYKHTQSTVNR